MLVVVRLSASEDDTCAERAIRVRSPMNPRQQVTAMIFALAGRKCTFPRDKPSQVRHLLAVRARQCPILQSMRVKVNDAELGAIEALRQLTARLSGVTELQTALTATLEAIVHVCSAQGGMAHIRRKDNVIELATHLGMDRLAASHVELDRCDTTAHRAARTKLPAIVEDFALETTPEMQLAARLGYRASLSVPLLDASGEAIAVFTAHFDAPHGRSERELSWAEMCARQAGYILQRTRSATSEVASEEHFRSIFQESNDFIVTADLQQRITYCNPATAAALGWRTDEIIGRSIAEFIPPPHFERTSSMLDQKLRAGGATRYEVDVIARDGHQMTWEINSRLTFGADGKPTGLHAIGRDVTTMRQAHEALRDSERALREADQRKDEFLAMLAHELRNPLAPIRTAAQILRMSQANPAQAQQASAIVERQVEHITRIVDDLLDLSRVTRGLVTLEMQPTRLQEVIWTAIEQVRPLIERRQHRLNVSLPEQSIVLSGEGVRLVQMISNLLSNAARHSGTGGTIELFVVAQLQLVEIHVLDHGAGIAPELLPRVFDLFAQGDRSPARSEGGLGIGLALVRRLAELHGGHVEAQSAGLGQGAEFTVVLPRLADEPIREAVPAEATPLAFEPLRVLIVDDNHDAANMLALLLQMDSHETDVEYTALSALNRARKRRYDAMLLDIGLPDLNGHELAIQLRAMPETSSTVLVAVTGYGQDEDRRRSCSAGFDHHLMKPVSGDELRRVLSRISRPRQLD